MLHSAGCYIAARFPALARGHESSDLAQSPIVPNRPLVGPYGRGGIEHRIGVILGLDLAERGIVLPVEGLLPIWLSEVALKKCGGVSHDLKLLS